MRKKLIFISGPLVILCVVALFFFMRTHADRKILNTIALMVIEDESVAESPELDATVPETELLWFNDLLSIFSYKEVVAIKEKIVMIFSQIIPDYQHSDDTMNFFMDHEKAIQEHIGLDHEGFIKFMDKFTYIPSYKKVDIVLVSNSLGEGDKIYYFNLLVQFDENPSVEVLVKINKNDLCMILE